MLDAAAAHDNDRTAQSTDGFSSICRARLPCLERGRELTAQPKGDQFTANWKKVAMRLYLDDLLTKDLQRKMVLITDARQVGKATLCRKFMERFNPSQCLNWDVAADSAVLQRQGDAMCGAVEQGCRQDWDGAACRIARALYPAEAS